MASVRRPRGEGRCRPARDCRGIGYPERVSGRNPTCRTVIVYGPPNGGCRNANRPVDVATTDHSTPVLAFFTVTDAPATLAPIESLTLPRIDASTVWARAARSYPPAPRRPRIQIKVRSDTQDGKCTIVVSGVSEKSHPDRRTASDVPRGIYRSALKTIPVGAASLSPLPAFRLSLPATQIRLEPVAGDRGDLAIERQHVASGGGELGTSTGSASFHRLHQRLGKTRVHRLHEKPRPPVAHSHRARSRRDRSSFGDGQEKIRLAGTNRDLRARQDADTNSRTSGC